MASQIEKLASAIHNNILGGLSGYHTNFSISLELLEDSVIAEKLALIKEYTIKGIIRPKDLYLSINCIPIDCKDLERCGCKYNCSDLTPTAHFEIPLLITEFGDASIEYIGSTDKMVPFIIYTSPNALKYHQYKKRGKQKPYVWIDTTPNENGMYDCFVFNAPLLESVSVIGAFKDSRLLNKYSCNCESDSGNSLDFLDSEIIDRVSKKMLAYYRQYYMQNLPNNLMYTPA